MSMNSPITEAARTAIAAAAEGIHSPAEKYIDGAEALKHLLEAYERAVMLRRKAESECEALRQENAALRRDLRDAYAALDTSDEKLFRNFTGGIK